MRGMNGAGALLASLMLVAGGGAFAEELPISHNLPAALAMQAATAAVESCAGQGYLVTATVVDRAGLVKAMLRGDGATPHTSDSSRGKAYTMVTFGPLTKLDTMTEISQRF